MSLSSQTVCRQGRHQPDTHLSTTEHLTVSFDFLRHESFFFFFGTMGLGLKTPSKPETRVGGIVTHLAVPGFQMRTILHSFILACSPDPLTQVGAKRHQQRRLKSLRYSDCALWLRAVDPENLYSPYLNLLSEISVAGR